MLGSPNLRGRQDFFPILEFAISCQSICRYHKENRKSKFLIGILVFWNSGLGIWNFGVYGAAQSNAQALANGPALGARITRRCGLAIDQDRSGLGRGPA